MSADSVRRISILNVLSTNDRQLNYCPNIQTMLLTYTKHMITIYKNIVNIYQQHVNIVQTKL
jgi:hypothetical protein